MGEKQTKLVAILTVGIVFAGGHLIGRTSSSRDERSVGTRKASEHLVRVGNTAPSTDYHETVEFLSRIESTAVEDFPALLEEAFGLENDELIQKVLRRYAIETIAVRWAKRDPRSAIEPMLRLDPEGETDALGILIAIWGRTDPDAAIKVGLEHNVYGVLDRVLQSYTSSDPKKFFELVDKYGEDWRQNERTEWLFHGAFEGLGKIDPSLLGDWINDEDQPEHITQSAAKAMGKALVDASGGNAYDALAAVEDTKLRDLAMNEAVKQLLNQDWTTAARFLERADQENMATPEMRVHVARAKAVQDPIEAARWLAQAMEKSPDKQGWGWAVNEIYTKMPANAELMHRFAVAGAPLLDEFNMNNFIGYAGGKQRGVTRYRGKLAEELLQLPQDATRDEMLVTMVGYWNREDTNAALAFANELPAGDLRRGAQQKILEEGLNSAEEILDLVNQIGWEGALPQQAQLVLAKEAPDKAIAHMEGLNVEDARTAAKWIALEVARNDFEAGRAFSSKDGRTKKRRSGQPRDSPPVRPTIITQFPNGRPSSHREAFEMRSRFIGAKYCRTRTGLGVFLGVGDPRREEESHEP
jgi:hypothetical protein